MDRQTIISEIEGKRNRLDETILRSARFTHNPVKTLWFYFLVTLNRYTPFNFSILAKTIWGDKITANETSAIGSVYFLGFYDIDVTLFLLKYFKETGDLLDIGSNIGYYASLFTQIADPQAKIVAFEPTPSTFAILQKNVSRLPKVQTEQIALSNNTGTINFFDYGHRHGVFNSTTAQPLTFLKNKGAQIEVLTDTLDNWCKKTDTKPSLIKLDTEGTEAQILREGKQTLSSYAPVILLEVGGGEAWSQNTKECLDILTEYHYHFFELTKDGEVIPHVRQETYTYKNLVCIPKHKLPNYVKPS